MNNTPAGWASSPPAYGENRTRRNGKPSYGLLRGVRRLRRARRGLAPMELAMWIPALLFLAVLMLNYGTVVVWRTRGEIASRDAAWRARPTREPGIEAPLRPTWPAEAKLTVVPDAPIAQLDHPAINHSVVRGPLPNGFVVRDTLNPLYGAFHGSGAVTRNYPLLPKIGPYKTGEIRDPLFDLIWTCRETGTWVNIARRTLAIYQLPTTDPSLPQAFANADIALLSIPNYDSLSVLDHDDVVYEIRGYYADFHPRINQGCQLDPPTIQKTEVNRLVISTGADGKRRLGQVLKVPSSMTGFYLSMFRGEIERLKAEIEQFKQELKDLPGQIAALGRSPGQEQVRAQMQSRLAALPGLIAANELAIPPLETKVEQLKSFQKRIPDWEEEMLER